MSADELRRAAAAMREQHGPDHERHAMWMAMADLLDAASEDWFPGHATKVARAYLATRPTTPGVGALSLQPEDDV